jgi:hypothetical protein
MARFFRTLKQSFISPVLSTSLYFVVFGTAIGSRMEAVDGVAYGAFIVPGLNHALGHDTIYLQCQFRDLFSKIHWDDL